MTTTTTSRKSATTTTSKGKGKATVTSAQANAIAAIAPDYDTALKNVLTAHSGVTQLDGIIESQMEARRAGRLYVIRAIAVLQTFPEVRTKADIKRATGLSQGTLYKYLDGLKALGTKRALETGEPTAQDIKKANSPWNEQATAKKEERQTKAEKRASGDLNPEDNAPEVKAQVKKDEPVKVADIHAGLDAAIAAANKWTKDHGFTAKEGDAINSKIAELSALVESFTTAKKSK